MRSRSIRLDGFHGAGLLLIIALSGWLAACGQSLDADSRHEREVTPAAGVPELGEIMSFQQMRHTKLWFAGQAENWGLAAYEINELSEGFDAVIEYHPTHEGSAVALSDAIPRMVTEPLKELAAIAAKKDSKGFTEAYDALTSACNNCHQAANVGFNRLQRPTMNPYPDQIFAPPPEP